MINLKNEEFTERKNKSLDKRAKRSAKYRLKKREAKLTDKEKHSNHLSFQIINSKEIIAFSKY